MVQGRKPDLKRRRRMADLRARGLTLAAIGKALGVTHQCVQEMLRRIENPRVLSVPCCGCGQKIVSAGTLPGDKDIALCLPCLEVRPEAPFGQRLKALRLAAGLTQAELARQTRVSPGSISKCESNGRAPKERNRARLIKVLGVKLAVPEPDESAARKKRRTRKGE